MNRTFHETVGGAGLALKPQNINSSAINGETILAPWKLGRRTAFLLIGAAMTTSDALTVTVQGRIAATGVWEALKDKNNSNLIFTVADTSDTGALENGFLIGTVDHGTVDAKYDAIRLSGINGVAQNVIVGAVYVIYPAIQTPSDLVDQLLSKQIYVSG